MEAAAEGSTNETEAVESGPKKPSTLRCSYCDKPESEIVKPAKLRRCTICCMALYCSSECQKAAWKGHKRVCRPPPEVPTTGEKAQEETDE